MKFTHAGYRMGRKALFIALIGDLFRVVKGLGRRFTRRASKFLSHRSLSLIRRLYGLEGDSTKCSPVEAPEGVLSQASAWPPGNEALLSRQISQAGSSYPERTWGRGSQFHRFAVCDRDVHRSTCAMSMRVRRAVLNRLPNRFLFPNPSPRMKS